MSQQDGLTDQWNIYKAFKDQFRYWETIPFLETTKDSLWKPCFSINKSNFNCLQKALINKNDSTKILWKILICNNNKLQTKHLSYNHFKYFTTNQYQNVTLSTILDSWLFRIHFSSHWHLSNLLIVIFQII